MPAHTGPYRPVRGGRSGSRGQVQDLRERTPLSRAKAGKEKGGPGGTTAGQGILQNAAAGPPRGRTALGTTKCDDWIGYRRLGLQMDGKVRKGRCDRPSAIRPGLCRKGLPGQHGGYFPGWPEADGNQPPVRNGPERSRHERCCAHAKVSALPPRTFNHHLFLQFPRQDRARAAPAGHREGPRSRPRRRRKFFHDDGDRLCGGSVRIGIPLVEADLPPNHRPVRRRHRLCLLPCRRKPLALGDPHRACARRHPRRDLSPFGNHDDHRLGQPGQLGKSDLHPRARPLLWLTWPRR